MCIRDRHWNIVDNPIYPACLAQYRKRHETSPDPPAYKSDKKPGTEGGSTALEMTLPSATSSRPPITSTPDDNEIEDQVQDILGQVFALRLETMQEMGFVREVDRALAKAIMSEFVRLQLIVGDDLNTSLWAMHADLEATTSELVRDLDIAAQNSTELPSENPAVGAMLHRFQGMVKLKLTLPLAQLDAAHEDMERFLHYRILEVSSQGELRNLLVNLSERMAAHQSRVRQIVHSEPLQHAEVARCVLVGMAAD